MAAEVEACKRSDNRLHLALAQNRSAIQAAESKASEQAACILRLQGQLKELQAISSTAIAERDSLADALQASEAEVQSLTMVLETRANLRDVCLQLCWFQPWTVCLLSQSRDSWRVSML